jgi:hypothetical protein
MIRGALLAVVVCFATAQENAALVVLDHACLHIVNGGTCDAYKLSAADQAKVDGDARLSHTSAQGMCEEVKKILHEQKDKYDKVKHPTKDKAYCQKIFDYNGDNYVKFKRHAKKEL